MEKPKERDIVELEQATDAASTPTKSIVESDGDLHGFMADLSSVPKGYYTSSFFIGTLFAVGMIFSIP